jgi:hypothetical protein
MIKVFGHPASTSTRKVLDARLGAVPYLDLAGEQLAIGRTNGGFGFDSEISVHSSPLCGDSQRKQTCARLCSAPAAQEKISGNALVFISFFITNIDLSN